ncbi:MAG TPA: hypothetical protein VNM90_22855 [Haliangium sp.]|nr:hypothetical protein [Haliangium sp.]
MHKRNLCHTIAISGLAALAGLAGPLAPLGSTGCGSFETRSIVLDLRILSLVVTPPEVLIPLDAGADPMNLPQVDVEVCALIADPEDSREIEYRMTACWPNDETLRCDDPARAEVLLTGTPGDPFVRVPDPEEAGEPVRVCATLPSNTVVPVLVLDQVELLGSYEAVAAQVLANGGNLDVQIEVVVRGADQDTDDLQYGSKRMRFAAPQCQPREANQNPVIDLEVSVDGAEPVAMPVGRCVDIEAPLEVGPRAEIELDPEPSFDSQADPDAELPPESPREEYCVPTFSGAPRDPFTENLTYTWYATHGTWELEQTGGPKNPATGKLSPVEGTWTAPGNPDVIGAGLDVPIWVVQRDERGGQSWVETCVRVVP